MKELTDRQLQILEFIHKTSKSQGIPPTIREICDALELGSTNTVADHLKLIRKKGALEEQGRRSRWLLLTPKGRKALGLNG